jgi:hypothetical protein
MVAARLYVVQSRFQLGCTLPHDSHWNISSSFHSFLIAVAPWIPSIDTEPSSNACYTPFGWLIGSIRSPMSLFINQFKIEYVYIYIIIYDYVCMCVYIYICICLHIYICRYCQARISPESSFLCWWKLGGYPNKQRNRNYEFKLNPPPRVSAKTRCLALCQR